MKKIQLTKEKFALVDDEDYVYLNRHNWYASKGYSTYYACRRSKDKIILMHRTVMNQTGNLYVDHKDSNGLNNQKNNLRICTQSQNNGNSKMRKDNKSGIKGVSWNKLNKNWVACITINYKKKHIGTFSNKLKAKEAYEIEAKKHFGKFYFNGKERTLV